MIVDVNTYYGCWPYWPMKVQTPEALLALLDRFAIDRIVVSSTRGIFDVSRLGNDETAALVQALPERTVGFATATPTEGEAALAEMDRCHALGMKGLKLFPQHRLFRLDDDPVLDEMMARAERWRWPVLIPIRVLSNWGVPIHDVREMRGFAGRHPGVQFILGGVNWAEMRDALAATRGNDNVAFETSCLQVHGGVKSLVARLGVGRVLFGSGLILNYPGPGLAHVTYAEVSEEDKERILGENAVRMLGL